MDKLDAVEISDTENAEQGALKAGKGSFWISKKAIELLFANQATAMDVCAYLVLARYTDASGQFSTAGLQAIKKAIGVGQPIAERATSRLRQMMAPKARKVGRGVLQCLLYIADDWASKTGLDLPHGPGERSKVRWVLNDFGGDPSDQVWISNELVDGIGRFSQPLKRLKRCGDVAARLLLVCYRETDLEQYGGVRPSGAFAEIYEMSKKWSDKGYDLWHAEHKNAMAWGAANLLGLKEFSKDENKKREQIAPLWRAIESLDSCGFIYQVVTAMDADPDNLDAQVIYELDTKSKHGYKPQGEKGVGGQTAAIAGLLCYPVADASGRLYGRYAVVVPAGVSPVVVGIYRVRFRVSNSKNYGVKGAWARIYGSQKEAQEWLSDLVHRVEFLH